MPSNTPESLAEELEGLVHDFETGYSSFGRGDAQLCERAAKALRSLATAQPSAEPEGEAAERLRTLAHNVDEMCRNALRIPHMPWPDPNAHSREAWARAVHASFCDLRFKLMDIRKEANAAQVPAAPAPAVSAPQPLTADEIISEHLRPCYDMETIVEWFEAGARFAERHHGIGSSANGGANG